MTDYLQWQGQDLLPLLRYMRKSERLLKLTWNSNSLKISSANLELVALAQTL